MIRSSDMSVTSPSPWQVGQAPNGELKENILGSRFSNTTSGWFGHAPNVLYFVSPSKRSSSFFVVLAFLDSMTIIVPLPTCSATSTASETLVLSSSSIFRLSTTASIQCLS
ncbi:Uncharacterised protein [uncultured archaeon]|nr:Uncharacterised protein [uncultured archaeon]